MKITCLGDSFTQGFLVEKNYTRFLKQAGFEIENLGINGDTTACMLERLPKEKMDLLIVFGGTNDFYQGLSYLLAYENIKSILKIAQAENKIVVIPPYVEEEDSYPLYERINRQIDGLAKELSKDKLNLVDARKIKTHYLDGLHMGESFHLDLSKEIIKKIKEIYD